MRGSARQRLVSDCCTSARSFAPRFLPTLGRPRTVAFRFVAGSACGGTLPTRVRQCWAHEKAPTCGASVPYLGGAVGFEQRPQTLTASGFWIFLAGECPQKGRV